MTEMIHRCSHKDSILLGKKKRACQKNKRIPHFADDSRSDSHRPPLFSCIDAHAVAWYCFRGATGVGTHGLPTRSRVSDLTSRAIDAAIFLAASVEVFMPPPLYLASPRDAASSSLCLLIWRKVYSVRRRGESEAIEWLKKKKRTDLPWKHPVISIDAKTEQKHERVVAKKERCY